MWTSLSKWSPLFLSSPSSSRAVHMQMDKVENGDSNVGMLLGLQILSFPPGTCKVEHLWARALQKLSLNGKKPRFCPLVKLDQKWTNTRWKRSNWDLWKLGKSILRRGRSSGAELCPWGVWLVPVTVTPCTPTSLSTPKSELIIQTGWSGAPKNTSGSGERWSRIIGNLFPSTGGNT